MRANRRLWLSVAILCALYFVSYVDRLILALVADAVKADLLLSDAQLALLIGLAFAAAYASLGLAAGWIADRVNRPLLISAGALVWGGSTIASAYSTSFTSLLVLRMGVAVGEALLTPATISLLADLFEGRRRTLATSMYLSAGVAGGACAYLVGAGALLAAEHFAGQFAFLPTQSWRLCLIMVGAPAVLLGLLLALVLRDPSRRTNGGVRSGVYRHLCENGRVYVPVFLATPLVQLATFSFSAWYPSFLHRTYDYSLPEAGFLFGMAAALGGVAGTILGPNLAAARGGGPARALSLAGRWALLAVPLCIAAPLASQPIAGIIFAGLALALTLGVGAFPPIIVQMLAPPDARAFLTALYSLLLSIIGFGGAPLLVTVASRLASPEPSLALGIAIVASGGCLIGGSVLWLAGAYNASVSPAPRSTHA